MSKPKRICGHCAYYGMWDGTCSYAGAFCDVAFEKKACEWWEPEESYDPSVDSASYDPEDDNY